MKKLLSVLMALALLLGMCAGVLAQEETSVSLVYLSGTDSFDPTTDYTRQLIKEELGVDIQPEMGNDVDKLNLILASGQNYDAIKVGFSRELLTTYINNNAIQDLTDFVDTWGPNLKASFSQDVWDMVSVDGRIYAIPETDTNDIENGIVVREDWLNKLGLSIPTTVDEFYKMLVAFSEMDPAEAGIKNIIPFAAVGDASTLGFNGLVQAFGIGSTPSDFVEVDGQLKLGYQLSGEKEYVSFIHNLYAEGLLDADFPATKEAALIEKVASGIVGCAALSCWSSTALSSLQKNFPDANLVYLPPLSKDGSTPRIASRGGLKNFLIVPVASTKVKEVVQYCNAFLDDSHYERLILGDKDDTYEVKNGSYYPIFPAFDKMNKGRWFYPTNDGAKYTPLFAVRAHKEEKMGQMWDDLNAKGSDYKYVDISHYMPLLPAFTEHSATLNNMSIETLMKMVISEDELAKYDAFVADWMSNGGQDIVDETNEWYQSRNKILPSF